MIETNAAKTIRLPNTSQQVQTAQALFAQYGLSRNAFIEAYREGLLQIGSRSAGRNSKIGPGEVLQVRIPDETSDYSPEALALVVLYEDPHLVVVEKPADLPMLPVQNETTGSLANRVQAYFDATGTKRSIRFVNRLDRGTSGIVLVAKHKYMQAKLQREMKTRTLDKEYVAIVGARMDENRHLHILTPLKQEADGYRYVPDEAGKPSHTELRVLAEGPESVVKLTLHTGRTHQIRAHLRSIGCPVLGDALYDGASADRLYLHAFAYAFCAWSGRRVQVLSVPQAWHARLGLRLQAWQSLLQNAL